MPTPSAAGTNLAPFAEGQRISGLVIDPEGLTSEQLNTFLSGIDNSTVLVETNNDGNKEVGSVYLEKDTTDYLQILLSVTEVEEPSYLMTRRYAIYAEASFSYNGETIPAGWSVLTVEIDENEHYSYSVEAMTEKETFNFGKSVTVTDVDSDFAPLNGVVIGIVEGDPAVYYNITSTITNGTVDGDEQCEKYGEAYISIVPSAGYGLPETVSVSGSSYDYDDSKGELVIYNPTGYITVTATCPPIMRSITGDITNGALAVGFGYDAEVQDTIGTATIRIIPAFGYTIPSSISVSGASYTYNDETGYATITNATEDVTITATCPAATPEAFNEGTVFRGVVIDPTAVSAADLATWLNGLTAETVMEYYTEGYPTNIPVVVTTIDGKNAIVFRLTEANPGAVPCEIICIEDDATYSFNNTTSLSLTKGWNVVTAGSGVDESTGATAAAIANETTYQMGYQGHPCIVDGSVSSNLATINGVAMFATL